VAGVLAGTVLHELYHYFAAENSSFIVTSYGVGVISTGSSEVVSYIITTISILVSLFIAVWHENNR
jgi:hypothetical protein